MISVVQYCLKKLPIYEVHVCLFLFFDFVIFVNNVSFVHAVF